MQLFNVYKTGTPPSVGMLVLGAANVGDRPSFHCECGRIKEASYQKLLALGLPL